MIPSECTEAAIRFASAKVPAAKLTWHFILMMPAQWALSICPDGEMTQLTFSSTSNHNSLCRYLQTCVIPVSMCASQPSATKGAYTHEMSCRLHPICPVTWLEILLTSMLPLPFESFESSDRIFNASGSVVCGYPKSST
jgi:hypothetical protein